MNICVGPPLSISCTHISIQSIGDSTYDGWYERRVFGTYSFVSIDARGNNIYHAKINGYDSFVIKDIDDDWVVKISIL